MVRDCTDWMAQVEAAIPTIVFDVKDGKGNDLSAVKVTMDGQPFADKLDGSALPVDPGEHRFTFDDADGFAHSEKTIVIYEGVKDRHESLVLGAPSGATAPAAATSPAVARPSDGSTQRTIGLLLGGVGVVGLGLGTVLGIWAKTAWDGSHDQCQGGCNALTDANVSTVAFIAGGVLLAAGAVVYFTSPHIEVGVAPSASGPSLRLQGVW
jgi:hypothetical protein